MFYDKAGKKFVPANISNLLTAHSLAYWMIDDGHLDGGTVLNTNAYTLLDVQLLQANEEFWYEV